MFPTVTFCFSTCRLIIGDSVWRRLFIVSVPATRVRNSRLNLDVEMFKDNAEFLIVTVFSARKYFPGTLGLIGAINISRRTV